MKLLIDGDLLVHRSTVACEHDTVFEDRYHILWSDETTAWNILEDTLHELSEQSGISDYFFAFSDPHNNFRKNLAGGYKSDRESSRKPLAYWSVRERCEETYESKMLENVEADDLMGLMMTKYPDEYVLWTIDKDLKQIPGKHLQDDEIITITENSGDRFFWFQVLAGDKVDGYSGCPGIGNVRAERLVNGWETEEEAWTGIVEAYEKAGQTELDALYSARMARILRHGEYKKGRPLLWSPPIT